MPLSSDHPKLLSEYEDISVSIFFYLFFIKLLGNTDKHKIQKYVECVF